ncbi:hypothetical protein Tco_1419030 [Tanacetum coccineum]
MDTEEGQLTNLFLKKDKHDNIYSSVLCWNETSSWSTEEGCLGVKSFEALMKSRFQKEIQGESHIHSWPMQVKQQPNDSIMLGAKILSRKIPQQDVVNFLAGDSLTGNAKQTMCGPLLLQKPNICCCKLLWQVYECQNQM